MLQEVSFTHLLQVCNLFGGGLVDLEDVESLPDLLFLFFERLHLGADVVDVLQRLPRGDGRRERTLGREFIHQVVNLFLELLRLSQQSTPELLLNTNK